MSVKPSHNTSIVNTQLYYDEFPLGVLLPWHKSLYARTQNPLISGTADADSTDYLVDSGADFVTAGVSIGDIAYNVTDGTYSAVISVASTALELSHDNFDNGNESYQIFKEPVPPVGWMEYSNNKITDRESPFYGLTPEDVIGEERFIRFCEVSGINQTDAMQKITGNVATNFTTLEVDGAFTNEGGYSTAGNYIQSVSGTTSNRLVFDSSNSPGAKTDDEETRPINISMVAIFKYKKAPAQTSTFQADKVITDELNITDFASMVDDNDILLPSESYELFEFNTPDCVSSKGRVPLDDMEVVYEPAKVNYNTIDTYENPMNKFSNKGTIGVFKAATNLLDDPEDLTTSNWTKSNSNATLTDIYIGEYRFNRLENSGAVPGDVYQDVTISANGYISGSVILMEGTNAITSIRLQDIPVTNLSLYINVTWSTQTLSTTITTGTVTFEDDWISTESGKGIVRVRFFTDSPAASATVRFQVRANSWVANEYSFCTAMMLEDSEYPTPYTKVGRAVGGLNYPYTAPSKFSFGLWVRPWFYYDVASSKVIFNWRETADDLILLIYDQATDYFRFYYQASGTIRHLESQQFDDGTTYNNINQWIYIAGAIDFTITAGTGQFFKVYADDGVNSTEDTAFSGTLDAWSNFDEASKNKLRIGTYYASSSQNLDSLITDFFILPNVLLTEAEFDAHYTANKPYYTTNRIMGNNNNFKIDKFGNAYFKNLVVE